MSNQICEIISKGAIILDVRSEQEFKNASNPKSLNIPLDKLVRNLSKFSVNDSVVVCCASGWRSQKAMNLLKRHGVRDVYNACSWMKTLDC